MFFFVHYVKNDYATFFVNYFKEKLVLFVEKISRKGNVRKRTMREDEVSADFGAKKDSKRSERTKTIEVEARKNTSSVTADGVRSKL